MHVLVQVTHPLHGVVRLHHVWASVWLAALCGRGTIMAALQTYRLTYEGLGALAMSHTLSCCRWWLAVQQVLTSLRTGSTQAPLVAAGGSNASQIVGTPYRAVTKVRRTPDVPHKLTHLRYVLLLMVSPGLQSTCDTSMTLHAQADLTP